MKGILKIQLILLINLFAMAGQAQPLLDHYPERQPDVAVEDYRHARMILEETYSKIREDDGIFRYADYWNLAIAYMLLDQDARLVRDFLFKSQEMNPRKFSIVFFKFGADPEKWTGFLTDAEFTELQHLATQAAEAPAEGPAMTTEEFYRQYDRDLIDAIRAIGTADQRYRRKTEYDETAQRELDSENLARIDALYRQYGTYLGRDLVGSAYDHVMWSVIQHSDLKSMERYLPVVHTAVREEQLEATMLKMLLDRIYARRHGHQLFGSQQGVPFATDATIELVRRMYGLRVAPGPRELTIPQHRRNPFRLDPNKIPERQVGRNPFRLDSTGKR